MHLSIGILNKILGEIYMEFDLLFDFQENKSLYKQNIQKNILQTNEKSVEFGLSLSERDAEMLAETCNNSICEQERIEFGDSIAVKLIEKFMQSSYISQNEYADIIALLIDIFYSAKEESLDILTDDEVIDIMFDFFENQSGGSVEMLETRDMDYLCRKIRFEALGL